MIDTVANALVIALTLAEPLGAVSPIIDSNVGCLLGGVRGNEWVSDRETADGLKGGESYSLITAEKGAPRKAIGGKRQAGGAPCPETVFVSLEPEPDRSVPYLATTGTWNTSPREPADLTSGKGKYEKLFAPILVRYKIRAPANVKQLYRVDLDGDGKDEIVAVLGNFSYGPGKRTGATSYSAILIRTISGQSVDTLVVELDRAIDDYLPSEFSVPFLTDLNGDGTMEVVVYAHALDGNYTSVYSLSSLRKSKALKAKPVLTCACSE